jgi:protein ImuA
VWPLSALESLRAQVRQIEGQHRRATPSLPFGVAAVDAWLPGGALPLGALHEIAGGGNGAVDGAAKCSGVSRDWTCSRRRSRKPG